MWGTDGGAQEARGLKEKMRCGRKASEEWMPITCA